VTTLSNDEIWRVLLRRLTPSARTGVTKLFPPAAFPPFFSFVLDALEKDAAIGRITPISGPLIDIVIQALSGRLRGDVGIYRRYRAARWRVMFPTTGLRARLERVASLYNR